MRSDSIALRNSIPGFRMCCWPEYSSSEQGRILAASGAFWELTAFLGSALPFKLPGFLLNKSPSGTEVVYTH